MIDDSELIRRYVTRRSEAAFTEIVRRHLSMVYATALRRANGDAQMAEDVAQQTFTALASSASSLRPGTVLAGWLYLTARHAAANAMRGERRRQDRENEAFAMHESLSSAENGEAWSQLRPELETMLETLDGPERDAIVLRYFENEPFAAIGAALGVSPDAARMRVDRALEKLRGTLAGRGVSSTTAALATALMSQGAVVAPSHLATAIVGSALAASANAAAASTFVPFIMNAKTAVALTTVMAAIATSAAIYQRSELKQARASWAQADADLQAAREAAKKSAAPTSRLSTASVAADGATPSPAAVAAKAPALPAAEPPSPFSFAYVLANPEMREPFLNQYALRTKAEYGRFFQAAGISPEQQQWFLAQSLELFKTRLDLEEAVQAEAAGASDEKVAALRAAAEQTAQRWESEFEHSLGERFGESGYAAYQRANSTMLEQRLSDQLASRLYWTESPLTSAQADQLVTLLRENRINPRKTDGANAPTIAGWTVDGPTFTRYQNYVRFQGGDARAAIVTDAMLARAQATLSPVQVAVLRDLQAQQLAEIQLAPKK